MGAGLGGSLWVKGGESLKDIPRINQLLVGK
jgi:hypothetical protein